MILLHIFMCYTVYVDKRNLTISLPKNLLLRAKIMAAKQEISLNHLIQELLEKAIARAEGYESSMQEHLSFLQQGWDLNTQTLPSRDELHERK